jgi:hypothetical protein
LRYHYRGGSFWCVAFTPLELRKFIQQFGDMGAHLFPLLALAGAADRTVLAPESRSSLML